MKGRFQTSSLIFYGVVGLMVAICLFCFVNALRWVNRPIPGFLMYHPPYVGSMGGREWAGYAEGLRYMDRIIEINGQPVRIGKDVLDAVRQMNPGTPVQYIVETKGKIWNVTVPVAIFGWKDFFLVFMAPFLGGLILYGLGFVVYVLKPNMKSSWVFLGLCFFTGTYMITGFDFLTSHFLLHLHILAIPLFPAAFFHLGLIFPERKQILNRRPLLEYLVYLPALVLALLYQIYFLTISGILSPSTLKWVLDWKQLSTIARIAMLFCALSLVGFQFHTVLRPLNSVARQRARLILFGVTLAFMPIGLIMFIDFTMKLNIPWNYPALCVLFFPAAIGYSIVKHNLFEADVIIKRTVGYFIVTAIVIGAYALVSISFNVFLGQYQLAQSRVFPILFTLGVILVFNPLRNRIQTLVDRIFFRKEYDYGAVVEKVSGAMTSLLDLPQIFKQLTQTFIEDMFINTGAVMLLTPDGTQYQVLLADGEQKQEIETKMIKRDQPLMVILEEDKKELTKYDVLEDPKFSQVSEPCAENFEALHTTLMVPLVYQDRVIGTLNLGEKKSGKAFNREDIDLLRTLAHQGAVAIENARMVEEIIEKERLRTKIMDSFGKYVTSEVRDQILEGHIPLDGELKDVTVLFADLRGFTTLTESTNPKEVVKIINGYFSEMAEAIGQNHGLVLQFIGDEIEAVFGAPTALEDHPTHAVRAALEMRKRLVTVNEKLNQKGYPPLRHGIGIHTGNVVAANIGSEDRLSYALVGDTVNVASRIQSLNKEFNTDILISAITLKRLSEYIHGEKLGATPVKGKKDPVEIFKLA